MDEMKEKHFTIKEAAERTRVSYATISNACKSGAIKAMQSPDSSKHGFHYLIPESELNKWLAQRKANVAEPKSIEELSALLYRMMKDEYERGFKDGKNEARRAFTEAVKGLK